MPLWMFLAIIPVGLSIMLTLIFTTAKAFGFNDWSWLIIFAPMWAIGLIVLITGSCAMLFSHLAQRKARNRRKRL